MHIELIFTIYVELRYMFVRAKTYLDNIRSIIFKIVNWTLKCLATVVSLTMSLTFYTDLDKGLLICSIIRCLKLCNEFFGLHSCWHPGSIFIELSNYLNDPITHIGVCILVVKIYWTRTSCMFVSCYVCLVMTAGVRPLPMERR